MHSKHPSRREFLGLAAAAATGTLLAACGPRATDTVEPMRPTIVPVGEPEEEEVEEEVEEVVVAPPVEDEVTIDVWAWDARASEDSNPVLQKYADSHPGVTINAMNMGFGDVQEKLLASFVSGTGAPHITFASVERFATFMKMDVFYEIPDGIMSVPEYKDTYFAESHEPFIWDGKPYGWCFDTGAAVWYHREDVIAEELGLDVPTSWDEFTAAAGEIADDTDGDGANDFFIMPLKVVYDMWLQGAGIPLSDEAGDLLPLSEEYFDQTVEVYERLSGWAKDDLVAYESPFGSASFEMFKNGQWLSVAVGNWYQSFGLKGFAVNEEWDGAWRINPWLPWNTGDDPEASGAKWGGACWAVPKQTEEVELAMDICKFTWANKENGLWMAKNRGIVSSVRACYEELNTIEDPFYAGQSYFEITSLAAERATGKWFGGPNYELFGTVFGEAMDRMVLEDVPVADALNDASTHFEEERKY